MPGWVRGLKQAGVLGLNRRNLDYILAENPRRCYPLVDDKLQTKQLARQAGIPIPPLYGVIDIQHPVSSQIDCQLLGIVAKQHCHNFSSSTLS